MTLFSPFSVFALHALTSIANLMMTSQGEACEKSSPTPFLAILERLLGETEGHQHLPHMRHRTRKEERSKCSSEAQTLSSLKERDTAETALGQQLTADLLLSLLLLFFIFNGWSWQ